MAASPFVAEWVITMVSCSHNSPVNCVPQTAPQVDHFPAAVIGTAGAAEFTPPGEVLGKRLTHRVEARADVPLHFRSRRTRSHPGDQTEHTAPSLHSSCARAPPVNSQAIVEIQRG